MFSSRDISSATSRFASSVSRNGMLTSRRWWTTGDIRRFRLLAEEEGLSARLIGLALGRTPGAVSNAASRYGISLHGESGAPFGNLNRTRGKAPRTRTEQLEANRLRSRNARAEGRWSPPAGRKPSTACKVSGCRESALHTGRCRRHYLAYCKRRGKKWKESGR